MKVSSGGQGRIEDFDSFVAEGRKVVRKTNSVVNRGRVNDILVISLDILNVGTTDPSGRIP
jgi:hypothetical protein